MKKIIVILAVIFIGSFLFYWFQWRPSEIKKECQQELKTIGSKDTRLSMSDWIKFINEKYDICLHSKGI